MFVRSTCRYFFVIGLSLGLSFSGLARAEKGVTPGDIIIGSVTGMTGPTAEIAPEVAEGARVYFDRVNRLGGVAGRKLQLTVIDNNYQPERTLSIVKGLETGTGPGVLALLGNTCTACCKAILPFLSEHGLPLLFAYSGGEALRDPVSKMVFNLRASYPQEADLAVRYVVNDLHIRKVGVVVQDDAFGTSGRSGVARTLAELGLKIHSQATFSRQTLDVAPAVEAMVKARPDAIYIQANPTEAASIIQSCRARGYRPIFMGPSVVGALKMVAKLGKDADNIYITEVLPLPTDLAYPLVREYDEEMKRAGLSRRSSFSLEGYADAELLVKGLEAVQKSGAVITRSALIAALEEMQNVDLGGLRASFSATDHQALRAPFLMRLKDGKVSAVK